MYNLLNTINCPADLRKLNINQLPQLCAELREFIIEALATNPGHFGASLGVVELTVAIHYVFDTPYDKLVWDVGHQAYGHKILTGRREQFATNRKYGGLSGFPNIFESEYDAFGVGHSSTSISAALGMAIAAHLNGENRNVVAVIGDGSMTGGEAFEALNNMAATNPDMLVILNDNHIAIDKATGSLSQYLLDISTSNFYNKIRDRANRFLEKHSTNAKGRKNFITKFNNSLKNLINRQSNMFEGLNIRYFGPTDGHDVVYLVNILRDLKNIRGPKMLHVITVKGKGFEPAEHNQTAWHAVGARFDIHTGERLDPPSDSPHPPRFQDVFGNTLIELAQQNDKILAVSPAMLSGSGMSEIKKLMPDRVFDVGIAEQHAVTFSAGLAISGYIPFCNIYSTFAQRAYDQIVHDVALQRLHVIFCFDRAGLVGADGATHHGAFDIPMLLHVPNIIISSPMDEVEMRNLMYTAQLRNNGPFVIRYPRGRGTTVSWKQPMEEIPIGKARKLRDGEAIKTLTSRANKLAFLSFGPLGTRVADVCDRLQAENINVAHYDMRFAKPLDEQTLHDVLRKYEKIVTVEDGAILGGFGAAIIEFANRNNYKNSIVQVGLPDRFILQGTVEELHKECAMDTNSIFNLARELITK